MSRRKGFVRSRIHWIFGISRISRTVIQKIRVILGILILTTATMSKPP